jgi:hypothetical protein
MNVEQAVKDIHRRQKLMSDAADLATAASNKYQAHMTLYNVAVMTGDKKEIEKQRDILHNLLDQILDTGYEVGTHQREINSLVRNVHE